LNERVNETKLTNLTLDQIIAVLNDLGLQLGTDIPNWPPSDLMQG